ncbi:LysM peptidoglycan-binding domain-containing protein [Cellvibrio sp. OA-2007]|uniref:LysM peptidoglycan-binding domain-containing protein n=1 Tax=Cellvibrio sp. OA-2007 TaxID=529823 RepID=UPI000785A904|nr:LysM domain-containing protein [Cellvibrio sp. OA-2007]
MTVLTPPKSGFEKWQDGLKKAVGDARWNAWDCEIQIAVNEYNRHLSGVAGYRSLDWLFIKAMLWTETGAGSSEWNIKPMRIGVYSDPGLTSFLSGNEGGNLILPQAWRGRLTLSSVRVNPVHNIRAGIGYLLMKLATYEYRSVADTDTNIYEVTVKAGDSFDKIAKAHGTTIEVLTNHNPSAILLQKGQVLKYQKASVKRVIVGWRPISTQAIAQRYNGGGDPNYAKKLDYALSLIRKGKAAVCAN